MKFAKLKYPTKIGDTLYPDNTIVEIISGTDERVKRTFPNIKEDHYSKFIAAIYPSKDSPCITHEDQLVFYNYMPKKEDVFYFGCLNSVGHFLYNSYSEVVYQNKMPNWISNEMYVELDGGLCPEISSSYQKEGVAKLTQKNNVTFLSFWDRSIDSRYQSHSSFFVKGMVPFDLMVEVCKKTFPDIWKRFKFEIVEFK